MSESAFQFVKFYVTNEFGLQCSDGKGSLSGPGVSCHCGDPMRRGERFNAASQVNTFYSWAVDPKPMAQDEAVHVRKPRVLVHRKPKTGPLGCAQHMHLLTASCLEGCAAQTPPGELKGTGRAGVKGPGDRPVSWQG